MKSGGIDRRAKGGVFLNRGDVVDGHQKGSIAVLPVLHCFIHHRREREVL